MAFEVETGSGSSSATSLVSVAVADERLAGVAAWGVKNTSQKQDLCNEMSEYISLNFNWRGQIRRHTQALAWPRVCVVDNEARVIAADSVPLLVQYAVCEAIKVTLAGDDLLPAEKSGIKKESVGAGDGAATKSVEYFGEKRVVKDYPRITSLLAGYVLNMGGVFQLRRQ